MNLVTRCRILMLITMMIIHHLAAMRGRPSSPWGIICNRKRSIPLSLASSSSTSTLWMRIRGGGSTDEDEPPAPASPSLNASAAEIESADEQEEGEEETDDDVFQDAIDEDDAQEELYEEEEEVEEEEELATVEALIPTSSSVSSDPSGEEPQREEEEQERKAAKEELLPPTSPSPSLSSSSSPSTAPIQARTIHRILQEADEGEAKEEALPTTSLSSSPPVRARPIDDFFTVGNRFAAWSAMEVDEEEEDEEEDVGAEGESSQKTNRKKQRGQTISSRGQEELYTSLNYGVVAIVGPQASGKSTLLNMLFGTQFPVLDVQGTGIQRTTRGVWVDLEAEARAAKKEARVPLVVLDTEGLESAARGEGSGLFDRQLSTLAAAAADIVLLNLWARDLRGGRVDLHRELLEKLAREGGEAAADSRSGSSVRRRKKAMIVVLRDSEHAEGDLAAAKEAMYRGLDEAYEKAGRGLPSSKRKGVPKIEDELDLTFIALPSLAYQREEFEATVNELRSSLMGKGSQTKMGPLTNIAQGKRLQPVPLPKFPALAQELWASITREGGGVEQTLAAVGTGKKNVEEGTEEGQGRGGEGEQIRIFLRKKIVESCCQEAEKAIERLERKVEMATEMPILEYGRDAEAILTTAIKSLKDRLQHCNSPQITKSKTKQQGKEKDEEQEEVLDVLGRRLEPSFRQHIDALAEFYLTKFEDKFAGLFVPVRQLDKEAKALSADIIEAFEKAAKTALPSAMVGGWAYDGQLDRLKDEIEVEMADRRMEVEVAFPSEEALNSTQSRFLRASWWKKVVLKVLVVYINYLQTVQAAQSVARAARRRQDKYPPFPLF